MKGDSLPDPDHVARHVKGTLVEKDGRIDGNAFIRKPGEHSPSVHWMEKLAAIFADQVAEVRRVCTLQSSGTAVFARLNVGAARQHVEQQDSNHRQIIFVEDPLIPPDHPSGDPSHSVISGLPDPDDTPEAEAIGDLLRDKVIDTFPAKPPKPLAAPVFLKPLA